MTDRSTDRRFPGLADMAEAARLTRTGNLAEATALIQRGLSGLASAARPAAETGVQPRTIDVTATRVDAGAEAPRSGSAERAAPRLPEFLPERLRGVIGEAVGHVAGVAQGLRGIAPALDGVLGGLKGGARRAPSPDDGQFVERSFANAAGARDYKLFVPTGAAGKRPLIVMLHGCSQSPDDFAAGTGMNAVAETGGVYVVYPRQSRSANAQKCWNWFQPGDQGRESGEAGIVAGIVGAVIAEHPIDPARVYIAGLSAGGAAASNIAHAYPDMFAGVGVHSGLAAGCARDLSSALSAMRAGAPGAGTPGGASGFGGEAAAAAVQVPTIVFHGDGDGTVSPRNADAVLAQAGIAGLRATQEPGSEPGGRPWVRTRYADADGALRVESWLVKGAGHAWSGGRSEGSYTDPQGPDASRAMLDFFLKQRLGSGRRS